MKLSFRYLLSALLCLLVAPAAAHASSIAGDTFSAKYFYPNSTTTYSTDPNFIADGSTHTATGGSLDFTYSLTGTQLILTFTANETRAVTSFNGVQFTDLTQSLAGYSISYNPASTDTDFATAPYGISGSSIAINMSGKSLVTGETAIYNLTSNIAATPEPSSLLLLATGALGAVGMVRRRFVA